MVGVQSGKGTAVVTGASSGIGAVYADRLARRGYDLLIVARSGERLNALAKRLTDDTGRNVEVMVADLTDPTELKAVETALRSDASITMLVNNAGIGAGAPLLDSDVDQMERLIAINVTALTRLTYAVVPGLVARGTGTIINIASAVDRTGAEQDLRYVLLRGSVARAVKCLQHAPCALALLAGQPRIGGNGSAMHHGQEAVHGFKPRKSIDVERYDRRERLAFSCDRHDLDLIAIA